MAADVWLTRQQPPHQQGEGEGKGVDRYWNIKQVYRVSNVHVCSYMYVCMCSLSVHVCTHACNIIVFICLILLITTTH